jgi:hypothetical protein
MHSEAHPVMSGTNGTDALAERRAPENQNAPVRWHAVDESAANAPASFDDDVGKKKYCTLKANYLVHLDGP